MDLSVYVILVLVTATTLTLGDGSGSNYQQTFKHLNHPIIQTTHGFVQGNTEKIRDKNGRKVKVDVFWGIPFAKPPVGDLRFRRPVSSDPWDGVLQATTPPNSCMQVILNDSVPIPSPQTPLSEDCLFLNIWRPRCRNRDSSHRREDAIPGNNNRRGGGGRNAKMSTLVWIYGGSYTFGSSSVALYNGANLAASECVIVASMNYRLGAFGFMYLDDKDAPGNMGLLDMVLAVKWINENVENFAGDRNNITIFGNSGGAASASMFLVSPLARDLYKNVIIQSGNPLVKFSYQSKESALEAALEFSNRLNCSSDNRTAIVDCLRQVNAAVLALEHLKLTGSFEYGMVATTDGYFLTQDPIVSLLSGAFKPCDIVIGTNKDEGTYALGLLLPDVYSFRRLQPPVPLTDQEINNRLSLFLGMVFKIEYIAKILEDVKDVYELEKLKTEVRDASLTYLNYIIGDLVFTCPARILASVYASASQKVYLYSFNHHRDNTKFPDWVEATHTVEVAFVFGTITADVPAFSSREVKLKQAIMAHWGNFAKYGDPTPNSWNNPKWLTYSPPDPGNILVYTESAGIKAGQTETRRCAYWSSLPPNYLRN